MHAAELDDAYTALCTTLTEIGEEHAQLFLARFALLTIEHIGDGAAVARLIDAAAEGVSDA